MEIIDYLIHFIIIGANAFFAFFVYFKNPKSSINRVFFLFVFALTGWTITLFLLYISSQNWVLTVGRLNFVFAEMIVYFGFYLGYLFPVRTFVISKINHFLLAVLFSFLVYITLWTDLISKDEIVTSDGIETVFGKFYILFALYFIVFSSTIFILPLYKYRKINKLQKMQVKYFVLGTFLSIIFSGTTNILFPFVFKYYNLQNFGSIGLFFFFGFTSYAIVRHQLFDIRIVIQRGIVYSALLATIIGVYIVIVTIIGSVFQQIADIAPHLAALIIIAVGIYGAPRIERYFRRKTDKIFFKDKYDYVEAIDELSEALNKNIDLSALLDEIVNKLKNILKVKKVIVLLPGQDKYFDGRRKLEDMKELLPRSLTRAIEKEGASILINADIPYLIKQADKNKKSSEYKKALRQAEHYGKKYNIALTAPVLLKDKLLGLVCLSEKMSGDQYSSEDISLLKTFSYQAAVAIEKAQLYEQVKSHSRELEKRVEQRTVEIKGLQEEQKQMMLEIAHGLQTPLTIIKGELSLLQEQFKGEKKIVSLEKTIDRTSKFIYDILRLAKLEADNGQNIRKEKVDLSALLLELTEDLEIVTREQNITTEHNIAPNIFILGEKSELSELVMNLVSNSIKYMGEGSEKKISINLISAKGRAELSIEDTGIGIDKKHLPRLFSRFYRIKDSKSKGVGLGMAISKRIAERHGGTIRAESELGKGTKLVVELPCVR